MSLKVTFMPQGRTVSVRPGTTIMGAAALARVTIRSRCGGKAACLMCKVENTSKTEGLQATLDPISDAERRKLGAETERNIRLACQAKVIRDTVITIPEDPLKAAIRKQLEKNAAEDDFGW